MSNFLVNKKYLIQKFLGKGGWFYIAIPEIAPNNKVPFGWVIINGFIDDYELTKVKLMPMGKGKLFLAVNVKTRKAIKKTSRRYCSYKTIHRQNTSYNTKRNNFLF